MGRHMIRPIRLGDNAYQQVRRQSWRRTVSGKPVMSHWITRGAGGPDGSREVSGPRIDQAISRRSA